jgi:hypothetical protein
MADAARFEECLTGRSYPVTMEGDYIKQRFSRCAAFDAALPINPRAKLKTI